MNERKPSFEERVRSGEGVVSLINQPLEPERLTALEIARRRWHMMQEGEARERRV